MRLSDIRGEDALDFIAELMGPVVEICSDPKVLKQYRKKGGKVVDLARLIIRNHKKAILTILALFDGEDPADYNPSLIEIPAKLMSLLNDPSFVQFFQLQGQNMDATSSGSAMANTEVVGAE